MWLNSLVQSLKRSALRNQEGRLRPQKTQRGRTSERLRFVPRLEALEDRTLLSTLTVLNTADSGAGSLRDAIAMASSGDTIDFAHKLSGKTIVLTSGQLVVNKNLDIEGPKAELLTISGNAASRVFDISGGATVTIAGLTIANGLAHGTEIGGGGILNESGTLTLSRDLITNNTAMGGIGGGLWNQAGASATVSGATFSDNQAIGVVGALFPAGVGDGHGDSAAEGGGIENSGTLSVTSSTFTHNQAVGGPDASNDAKSPGFSLGTGAGIDNYGTLSVTNSTFTYNQARSAASGVYRNSSGGGIGNHSGPATVTGCTFNANQALGGPVSNGITVFSQGGGGGIESDGPIVVTDSSFTGNRAVGGAGATSLLDNGFESPLWDFVGVGGGFGTTVSVVNSTFTHNEAIGGAGGPDGPGGPGLGGGLEVYLFSKLTISGSSFFLNTAVGGAGGSGAPGGDGVGGGINVDFNSTAIIAKTTVTLNAALGGAGGAGASGGNGWGGGLSVSDFSLFPRFDIPKDSSSVTLSGSTIAGNLALGGAGTGGGNGGNGSGGGVFIGGPDASLDVTGSKIALNFAIGGPAKGAGKKGLGKGGGVYNLGTLSSDTTDVIALNFASTSNDNIFP